MRRVPSHGEVGQGAMGPRAILSRLLVVLALVLFGLPQGHADGMAANAGPTAQSQIEQAMGIPSTQRPLLRTQLPDDMSPEAVVPGAAIPAWTSRSATTLSPASLLSFLPTEIRILPPVRGPPAA